MKKHKWISIFSLILFFALPMFADAQASMPFGGRVTQLGTDLAHTIVCSAPVGPFLIRPYNAAVPGPYFARTSSKFPKRGGYALGLYKLIPDVGTCVNPATGAPLPAFELKIYGVSR